MAQSFSDYLTYKGIDTMKDDSKEILKRHVQSIADHITNPPEPETDEDGETKGDAFDYLSDVLDIEYIVNGKRQYIGARVLVAFGGPNIWIDTSKGLVEGYWWGDRAFANFEDTLGLDSALETLWNC